MSFTCALFREETAIVGMTVKMDEKVKALKSVINEWEDLKTYA